MNIQREIEVKLRVADAAAMRRRLAKLGAKAGPAGRVHERNTVFDTPQGGLAKHGQLLRIRKVSAGGGGGKKEKRLSQRAQRRRGRREEQRAVMTFKGPTERMEGDEGRFKVREEREVELTDPVGMQQILEGLGLRGWFRYEKYRTTFVFPKSQKWAEGLVVELDETPIGCFLELEGPRAAIDRAAELLGYGHGDYVTKSYLALYVEECRRKGVEARDMIFGTSEEKGREGSREWGRGDR